MNVQRAVGVDGDRPDAVDALRGKFLQHAPCTGRGVQIEQREAVPVARHGHPRRVGGVQQPADGVSGAHERSGAASLCVDAGQGERLQVAAKVEPRLHHEHIVRIPHSGRREQGRVAAQTGKVGGLATGPFNQSPRFAAVARHGEQSRAGKGIALSGLVVPHAEDQALVVDPVERIDVGIGQQRHHVGLELFGFQYHQPGPGARRADCHRDVASAG